MRAIVCLGLAGCGTQSVDSFLLDTPDCAVVNTFKVDGAATPWTDCRVYWAGSSTNIFTVELTTPGQSGSFVMPASSWIRASVFVPASGVDDSLAITPFASNALPTTLAANQLALDMPLACGNLGSMQGMVRTMADVGNVSTSMSMSFNLSCGAMQLSGGFIVSAAAQEGSTTTGDPATVVTTP
jgi:hypothetical protein